MINAVTPDEIRCSVLQSSAARTVLEASMAASQRGEATSIALVIEIEGSTYGRPGTMALFGGSSGQVGWLSGGCLEPEIERSAIEAARNRRIGWLDIDTRDDEDLLSGSAIGCRGRLRIALLPLQLLDHWSDLVVAWRKGAGALQISVKTDGGISYGLVGRTAHGGALPAAAAPVQWGEGNEWRVEIAVPPTLLSFGAGPETPILLPLLRRLGWMTTVIERRPRWTAFGTQADVILDVTPANALSALPGHRFTASVVMHHNFEMDRESLLALAEGNMPFIGLLGPVRRREDLFRVLPASARAALLPRLHSPVGLHLGGSGPEAIALSIAAQLHSYRHGQ